MTEPGDPDFGHKIHCPVARAIPYGLRAVARAECRCDHDLRLAQEEHLRGATPKDPVAALAKLSGTETKNGHTPVDVAVLSGFFAEDDDARHGESPRLPVEARLPDYKPPTDTGNAQRLVQQYSDRMAYLEELGWLAYDGTRFVRDCLGILEAYAKATIAALYEQAFLASDDKERRAFAEWAMKSDNQHRIRAMVDSARSEFGISRRPEDFDSDPSLLNAPNCVIDVTTGDVHAHDPKYMMTKLAGVRYDNEAQCPRWERFLNEIMGGDQELVAFLQRAVGYSITASRREQVWFLLYGKGANGKSTFLTTIGRVLGDYFQQTDPSVFLQRNRDGPSPEIARLRGARMIAASEPEENRRLAESFIKQWTGEARIIARHLRREPIEFEPVGKIWLSANHLPHIRSDSHAMWRRVLPIPFLVRFTNDPEALAKGDGVSVRPMDKDLEDRLAADEGPGILAWCVRGAIAWAQQGLQPPAKVTQALEDYKREMDPLADFLDACCILEAAAKSTVKEVYDAYVEWCTKSAADPIKKRTFTLALKARDVLGTNNGCRGYQGIKLTQLGQEYSQAAARRTEARHEDGPRPQRVLFADHEPAY